MCYRILIAILVSCFFMALGLSASADPNPMPWRFVNGSEFKGATGSLSEESGDFVLKGNFTGGGSYVAMIHTLNSPLNSLMLASFRIKTAARQVAVRFIDAKDQTHQHFVPLSGDGASFQRVTVRAMGSLQHHWGGPNDGRLQLPVKTVLIVSHRADFADNRYVEVRIRDIDFVSAEPSDGGGFPMPENFAEQQRTWRFTNGPECRGAQGHLDMNRVGEGILRLTSDFRKGGSYVAGYKVFPRPQPLTRLTFDVNTNASGMDVRFEGDDGQIHQHFIKLSGNPDDTQKIEVLAKASPNHHWGGKKDGILRQPIRRIFFSIHKKDWPEQQGSLDFSNTVFYTPDHQSAGIPLVTPARPESLFRRLDDSSVLELKVDRASFLPSDYVSMYYYTDYLGEFIEAGKGGYDAATRILTVPPPKTRGFADLHLPALGGRLGIMSDGPAPKVADEFFAVDSSFSWGAKRFSEEEIRAYCRILKNNGILWNRDRLSWVALSPAPDSFSFDSGNFSTYRRVASEEGIKTLDTFHDTPKWLDPRVNPAVYGPNPYPAKLKAAGEDWVSIVRHFQPTLQALEVWNEPDIGFGSYFPADQVSSLTKAVSWTFRNNGIDTLVVGGVFAHPWPGTSFQEAYVSNGLLDASDVITYHTYDWAGLMERTLAGWREHELALKHPRAGLPIWITEAGFPWNKGSERAILPEDIRSAVEITAKAVEFKALGVEKYFAFEYKYYQEGEKNFGMMGANHSPMRSMAVYTHAAKILAHRDYIGDLTGTNATRSRVFSDGKDSIVVLYAPVWFKNIREFTFPRNLPVAKVTGIDGRVIDLNEGRIGRQDGIAYLYLKGKPDARFLKTDTPAMKYFKMAREFKRRNAPRATLPVVFRSSLDVSDMTFNSFGYNVRNYENKRFDVSIQNLSDEPQSVRPELELPKGVLASDFQKRTIQLAPGATEAFSFKLTLDPKIEPGRFRMVRVVDKGGNALPLAFSLRAWQMQVLQVPARPNKSATDDARPSANALLAEGGWINFSAGEYWHSWQGGEMQPNIEAHLRAFHAKDTLQLQVLVKDKAFYQPYEPFEAFRGDSLQVAIQQRERSGLLPKNPRIWNEVTAAKCGDRATIYGHMGSPSGLYKKSRLRVQSLGNDYWLYVVDFDAGELNLDLSSGSRIGFSLLVNSNAGQGRDGFLSWGGGIGDSKDSTVFNCLEIE